ncbi:MAG: glycine cleavage system protein GcvH [Bacteroidales bacterium]
MNIPENLKYTEDHEWLRVEENNVAYIGVTHHAQNELGDVVYVECETEGEELNKGDAFGTIEAVKTVADMFMPVDGTVTEFNEELDESPETINDDPYDKGWVIKVELSNPAQLDNLMTAEQYAEHIQE